jgi:hypothetical protein
MGRFIGLFLADGNYNDSGVSFTFDKSEEVYIDFLKNYIEPFGAKSLIVRKDNYVRLVVYSQGLKAMLKEYCIGLKSKDKGLKSKVYGMSKKFREGIADGWLEGDGLHFQYQDGETISKGMAKTMLWLFTSIGRYVTSHNYNVRGGGRRYRIHWVKNPKVEYENGTNPPENCVFTGIKYKNPNFVKKTALVDIEVDSEDHLFSLADGLVTHNCHFFIDPKKASNLRLLKSVIMRHYCRDLEFKPDLQLAGSHLIRAEFGINEKTGHNKTKLYQSIGYPNLNTINQEVWDKYIKEMNWLLKISMSKTVNDLSESEYIKKLLDTTYFNDKLKDGRNRILFVLANVLKGKYEKKELIELLQNWYKYCGGSKMTDGQIAYVVYKAYKSDQSPGLTYILQLLKELGVEE